MFATQSKGGICCYESYERANTRVSPNQPLRSRNPAMQRAAETDRDAQLRSIDTRAGPELRTAERQSTPAARRTPWTHALDAQTKSRLSETSHGWQDFRSMLGSHPAVQLAMGKVTCSLSGTAWPAGRDRNLIGLHKICPAGEGAVGRVALLACEMFSSANVAS